MPPASGPTCGAHRPCSLTRACSSATSRSASSSSRSSAGSFGYTCSSMNARTRVRSLDDVGRGSEIDDGHGVSIVRVRLGYYMGYAPPGTNPVELIARAQHAERLGFDSAWAAEAWGTDAVTVLSWLAATTTTLKVGSAIMQMPGRTPANTAMTAATLDLLSGGRFLLGLGHLGPAGRRGLARAAVGQAARTHARVRRDRPPGAAARDARARRRRTTSIPYRGPDATGLGKPLKLMARPLRARPADLPRGARPEERRARGGDRGRLAADLLLADAVPRGLRTAARGSAATGSTSRRACRSSCSTTSRRRATR